MKFLYCVCLLLGAGFSLGAQTNPDSSMLGTNTAPAAKTNSSMEIRPTEIDASSFRFFMKSNVAIYTRDVRVDNPQMKLTCALLTVEFPKFTNGTYNQAIAQTNVDIYWWDVKGTNHATADKAVYTYIVTNTASGQSGSRFETNSTIVLTGNPIVTDPSSNVYQGDPIFYDRITGEINSPNMKKMLINSRQTNSSSVIETPGARPSKTNTPAR